jgi:uncharacterized protein (TIGR03437 family)
VLVRVSFSSLLLCAALAAQSFTVTAVRNAARGDTRLSPGALATVTGSNFPVAGVAVRLGERSAPVVGSVSTGSFNFQVPYDMPLGDAPLVVTAGGAGSNAFPVTIEDYAPGIFTALFGSGAFVRESGGNITAANPAAPGEVVSFFAVGLGATNPVVAPGNTPPFPDVVTVVQPRVLVRGRPAAVRFSGLSNTIAGVYQVTFVVPNEVLQGENPVVMEIAGKQSNIVQLLSSGGPPVVGAVVNAASFQSPRGVAPGSLVSVFATNLGPQDYVGLFPRTNIEEITVLFNNIPAPLTGIFASRNQINVYVPPDLGEGSVNVSVSNRRGRSDPFPVTVTRFDPGIFLVADPSDASRRIAAALFANTAWLVMPATTARAYNLPACAGVPVTVACGQPARAGDVVQIYVTGLGRATPNGDPGGATLPADRLAPANPLYQTVDRPLVTVGGVAANVLFSGLAPGFAGLYQINIAVPGVPPGDDTPLRIETPGGASAAATIAIRN